MMDTVERKPVMDQSFPMLQHPPIVEVVCGIVFERLELDGMVLGVYWDGRKDEFPERSLQPALSDEAEVILGNPPLRGVLVSSDRVRWLQIQHDRFVMNWRAMGEAYPRFSSRGDRPGLKAQTLEEFAKLSTFCEHRLGRRPLPTRVELTKIDVLERIKHWTNLDDLSKLIGLTGTFNQVHRAGNREFGLRFVEHDKNGKLLIAITSILDSPGGPMRAVRVQTRAALQIEPNADLDLAFTKANQSVNGVFFTLLNKDELTRFGSAG